MYFLQFTTNDSLRRLKNRSQKVMVNGAGSEWENVISGSVLGPILFVIYINDLPDTVESDSYLFTDDTKIFSIIKGEDDKEILQDDLTKLEEWSDKWFLKFHPEKCKHMKISKSKYEKPIHINYLDKILNSKPRKRYRGHN